MQEAVEALGMLLSARKETNDDNEDGIDSKIVRAEEQTAKLLKYGIYSDTHLLALVYQVRSFAP